MRISQSRWTPASGWQPDALDADAQLVLVFGDGTYFRTSDCYADLRARHPRAHIVGCSSAGNIDGSRISDDAVVATTLTLDRGRVALAVAEVAPGEDLAAAAAGLVAPLTGAELVHLLVISEGLRINGSQLAQGLNAAAGGIPVSGGLAADGPRFGETVVMADSPAAPGRIAAIGLYGPGLRVRTGCLAGWDEFGPERLVTRAAGNVVYEIDNQPALALYKRYLGELAEALPGSGLRFPLAVRLTPEAPPVIRTLLAVDEATQSLTFAGDIRTGQWCRLMKANIDGLIESAGEAAVAARADGEEACLCVAVSCVGRRLVMGQNTESELEVVLERLGPGSVLTGFYSYGELAPFRDLLTCELHNQTMTLTAIYG